MATIALVNPPAPMNITRRWRCAVEQGHYLFPPIELCYLASVIKKAGNSAVVFDCVADHTACDELKSKLAELDPEMVIAIPGYEHINEDIETMSGLIPAKSKLAIFGHLASLYAKELLTHHKRLDVIVLGEPEETVGELAGKIDLKDKSEIMGLTWKDSKGSYVRNKDRPDIKDLDTLPFPDRSQIDAKKYFSGFPDKEPFTTIVSARGCNYRCTYCVRSYGDILRQRSVENVMAEMKECEKMGIKTIRFLDDTFTARREWVKDFCKQYHSNGFKMKWTALARPDNLDEELIAEMAGAGCNRVMMGVEAGSKRVLVSYARNPASLDNLTSLCKTMRKHGIQSFAFFLIGGPDETLEEMKESLAVAKQCNPDFITLNMMRAYPGTTMYDQLAVSGHASFNIMPYHSTFKANLPDEEVQKFLFTFYRGFYFSPKWFFTHIPMMIRHFPYMMKLGMEYLSWETRGTNFGKEKPEARESEKK